jgi:hypothetical protein
MGTDKKGDLRIVAWTIEAVWSDGRIDKLNDCDDTTAGYVDEYLSEIEEERNANSKN